MIRVTHKAALAAGLALLLETAAWAITYVGSSTIDTHSVNLSITTDGTQGVLAAANITDWTVAVTGPGAGDNFTYTPGNSVMNFLTTALSATPTQLLFDFGAPGGSYFQFAEFPLANPNVRRYWCVQTGGGCLGFGASDEAAYAQGRAFSSVIQSRFGVAVLATAPGTGGVPEPAAWALLIGGFGLVGAVARRQRAVAC